MTMVPPRALEPALWEALPSTRDRSAHQVLADRPADEPVDCDLVDRSRPGMPPRPPRKYPALPSTEISTASVRPTARLWRPPGLVTAARTTPPASGAGASFTCRSAHGVAVHTRPCVDLLGLGLEDIGGGSMPGSPARARYSEATAT